MVMDTKFPQGLDMRKPMLAFEKTFDRLLKADEHIDKLILGMAPRSGANVAECVKMPGQAGDCQYPA